MKYKCQGNEFVSILKCTLPEISNTRLGHVRIEDFWKSMEEGRTPLAQKILDSGLAHVVGHPPTVQRPYLVLECMKSYDHKTRDVKTTDGSIM